ncbi:MAG: hypothetical protein AAGE43_02560 [Pseudomonadota bacterium]
MTLDRATSHPLNSAVWTIEGDDHKLTPVPMDAAFWPNMKAGKIPNDGLISFYFLDFDFPQKEMHPKGDELLVLHDGQATVYLEGPDGVTAHTLKARESLLIPKGVWHWAQCVTPGWLTVITFGGRTEHKALTSVA